MKWVAISLLLLNGFYLSVQLNKDPEPIELIDRFPFSGQKLMLLAEKERLDKSKQLAEKNRRKALAQAKASKPKKKPAKTVAQAGPGTRNQRLSCFGKLAARGSRINRRRSRRIVALFDSAGRQ
jgi:hypothetical protein